VTAPRGTPSPAPILVVTDDAAPVVAAAVLASPHGADPRVAALCRWALAANVAGLRRDLAAAGVEATLAREDFYRMRALHADRAMALDPDTIDDDLSDAVPILLKDDEEGTPVPQAAQATTTIRIQRARHLPFLLPPARPLLHGRSPMGVLALSPEL